MTGWQTIDGKVYYYQANGTPVTGDQVIGGVKYTFSSDGSLSASAGSRGIDVSKWQGKIDWGAVASSGISFAIIRVGYRGASTGALVEDPYFKTNISGATKAGIKVGVYFFTQAISEAEAVEEASMVLSKISGYKITYPVFIDTENASNGRANGLDKNTRTAVVSAFCRTIQNGGYKAGVYASKNWYSEKLNASSLGSYCIWVAQYNSSCTYSGRYNMWQYSSKGTVSGISGNVDMNISYLGY
jgi:GH25 family lysozyme M1 (1,4-beta-N-acetylmuramidase)